MSLPLTRRIAQAALLVAAGTAPLIGAGATQAAPAPAPVGPGALGSADASFLGDAVDDVSRETTDSAGQVGANLVRKSAPAAGKVVGSLGKSAVPSVAGSERLLGTAKQVGQALPADTLRPKNVSTNNLADAVTDLNLPIT
ncbi:ATP-binding protein [Streptomyces zagrosensis]|uniref:ATP-binding protein n=1 Tax=Streptomyces zagrosensis TaxID=1042984 RepID=A0A7W9QD09_9ACTN|nr:ATP-binding protein [Streptomyces zagrosensis]MBB5936757.1 hypothetical protein [Streptomyces zagrosensis]